MDRWTVALFTGLVAAVVLHEISHGVAALAFGDDTARRAGRITLNPVPHIDPFGSLVVPAVGALSGLPVIGWAKPVPVNAARLRRRSHLVWVSLAGPGTNLALTIVAAIGARWSFAASGAGFTRLADLPLLTLVLFAFALVNLLLGVFNLLPIPPLDGAALLERTLPERMLEPYRRLAPYGILVLLLLVFTTDAVPRLVEPLFVRLAEFVVL